MTEQNSEECKYKDEFGTMSIPLKSINNIVPMIREEEASIEEDQNSNLKSESALIAK